MEIVGYEMSEIGDEARWRAEGGDQLKKTEPRRQNMEIEMDSLIFFEGRGGERKALHVTSKYKHVGSTDVPSGSMGRDISIKTRSILPSLRVLRSRVLRHCEILVRTKFCIVKTLLMSKSLF